MLSHLNYLFPQYPTQAKMMANDMPSANQQNHIEQEAEEEATTVLQSPKLKGPADHVAFVIHGIGQQTEQFGFFQKHLQSLYDTTNKAVQENTPEKEINIQYIPIEWHKHIHEETDAIMDDITLRSIPTMRMVNNDYLADAFFYLSKERGQSIINHVTRTFNEAYLTFIHENPGFHGKIAILAYSLGGIITWDILSNQQKTNKHSKLDGLVFPELEFKPDYLFTLGSPLSAFLTVRNQDPKLYHPHPSIIFENIFHPFDPLAYRFEPLVKSNFKNEPAVLVDKATSSIWEKGRDLFSRQQDKFLALLSAQNNKEKKTKQDLHQSAASDAASTINSSTGSGNTMFDTLKRYFNASPSSLPFVNQNTELHQQEDDDDEDMVESTTSTPKLSLDCGSVEDEDEAQEEQRDYFLIRHSLEVEENKEQQQKTESLPFIYIPHTDMSTATSTPKTSMCKRRHHSFDSSTTKIKEEQEEYHLKKKRRSSYDIELLNSTITKGSSSNSQQQHSSTEEKEHPLAKRRIDFVLQPEKLFFGCLPKNEYVSGLTAHFSYWTHKDLMWHIVRRLENNSSSFVSKLDKII